MVVFGRAVPPLFDKHRSTGREGLAVTLEETADSHSCMFDGVVVNA